MTTEFVEAAHLDKLVHEPARLAILTALDACANADFVFLQRLTGLTAGNLSAHLAKLQEGGLVRIEKQFVGRVPNTKVALTKEGRAAVKRHWRGLRRLQQGGAQLRTELRRSAQVLGEMKVRRLPIWAIGSGPRFRDHAAFDQPLPPP